MQVVAVVCAVILTAALAALVGMSLRSKRAAGRVLFRFDNSTQGQPVILTLFGLSLAVWLFSMIAGAELHFLLLAWAPVLMLIVNPAYLGEAGLKAGYAFMNRSRIQSYRWKDADGGSLRLEMDVEGLPKPLVLTVFDGRRKAELNEVLDAYLQRNQAV